MKKTILLMFLILFSFSLCLAHDEDKSHYVYLQDPNDLINPNSFYKYMIIKNDYLSYLSNRFYNDSWKWTKIHQANPYIVDPNWIYPNNWLVIPDIYPDENGNPITDKRSFTYQTNDLVNPASETKTKITKENILNHVDSPVRTDNEENIDNNKLLQSKTQDIESESEIMEQLEINVEDATKIKLESSTAITYRNYPKKDIINHSDKNKKSSKYKKPAVYRNSNWVIGLYGGYPFGEVSDEDDNLAYGLLIGTPLNVTFGPISARLGGGFLGYDFADKLYPGAGVLLNLAISELFKWTTPAQLLIHGTRFYVPEGGTGTGVIVSTSVPLGKSPFNIGLYIGIGEYNNDSVKSNWKNTGLLLQLQL
ncbi:MAG: hypothetical protein V3W20_01240 [Candidatus Neomarinimicrobiota bacterium]